MPLTPEEIQQFIADDSTSERKVFAKVGERYYEGDHDIRNYRVFFYDSNGDIQEDKDSSNIRISHPFFTELVDQEVQYMTSGDRFVTSENDKLQAELDEYFDDDFRSELNEVLTCTVSDGFGYMYAYTGSDGRLKFESADSIGVVEVRAKDTDDNADYIIYWYIDRIDKGKKLIKRIQVWDTEQTYYYVQVEEGTVELDETQELNPRPHVIYEEGGDEYYRSLGFIPFFRLDNNRKQFSALRPIKDLIDDYDLMSCALSNNLQDFTQALYVVKGFQGDNLDELTANIKAKKRIGVSPEGDVEIRTVDIPYEARKVKLELDERNIYRFGMGLNSAQVGDGNITNVVIKSRYALLDLKCNKLEIRLKQFMRKLIKIVLDEINDKMGTDYRQKDVNIEFEREVMTNALDNAQIAQVEAQTQQTIVNTILAAAMNLGDEVVLEQLCTALDLDYDEVREQVPESPEQALTNAANVLTQSPTEPLVDVGKVEGEGDTVNTDE